MQIAKAVSGPSGYAGAGSARRPSGSTGAHRGPALCSFEGMLRNLADTLSAAAPGAVDPRRSLPRRQDPPWSPPSSTPGSHRAPGASSTFPSPLRSLARFRGYIGPLKGCRGRVGVRSAPTPVCAGPAESDPGVRANLLFAAARGHHWPQSSRTTRLQRSPTAIRAPLQPRVTTGRTDSVSSCASGEVSRPAPVPHRFWSDEVPGAVVPAAGRLSLPPHVGVGPTGVDGDFQPPASLLAPGHR